MWSLEKKDENLIVMKASSSKVREKWFVYGKQIILGKVIRKGTQIRTLEQLQAELKSVLFPTPKSSKN